MRCCSRYTNRRVRCHLRGLRLIGYTGLDPPNIRLISALISNTGTFFPLPVDRRDLFISISRNLYTCTTDFTT